MVFGLAGPPIGLAATLGLQIVQTAIRSGLPAVWNNFSEVIGLTPSGALLCYLAAPSALAAGACMRLCENRVSFPALLGLMTVAGALLSAGWYLIAIAALGFVKFTPFTEVLGVAPLGALASAVCTLITRRRSTASQRGGGVTQTAA